MPRTAAACAAAAAEICTSLPLAVVHGLPNGCGPSATCCCCGGDTCSSAGAATAAAIAEAESSSDAAGAACAAAALVVPVGAAPSRSFAAWAKLTAGIGTIRPAPVDHPTAVGADGGVSAALWCPPASGGDTATAASSATSLRSLKSAAKRLRVAAGACTALPFAVFQPLPALDGGGNPVPLRLSASGVSTSWSAPALGAAVSLAW